MTRKLKAADLFCGAGGTTAGAEATGGCRVVFAVNHWQTAVDTHSANFPHTKHVNSRIDEVNPAECGKLDALFASPECTHHSRARGGRPTSDQQRSGAWDLMRWIDYHRMNWLVVENVKEFIEWGPVSNGKPMKSKRGAFFDAWVMAIRAAGYQVDWRVMNAADYGAATSRERVFVIARKGRKNPVFPEPTHCNRPGGELPGLSLPRWRPAAEVIDWSIPCPSIFGRKRPLADKTLARIEAGLRRFVGPFVAQWDQQSSSGGFRGVDRPLGTMVTKANMGLAVPFQYQLIGRGAGRSRDVEDPVPTMVATRENHGVAVPYMVPFFGERDGQLPRSHDVGEAMPCVTSHGAGGVAVPFCLSQASGGAPRDVVSQPVPTIVTGGAVSMVCPYLFDVNHGDSRHASGRTNDVNDPLGAITSTRGKGLAIPFLSTYYGNGGCTRTDCPLPTLTTKERVSLSLCALCGIPPQIADPTPAMRSLLKTMAELGVADRCIIWARVFRCRYIDLLGLKETTEADMPFPNMEWDASD